MAWRVAKSLDTLLAQINEAAPNRSKISDGSIGDTAHSNRTSDHNPWCGPGVVTARDFTHDPKNGADMAEIAEALRESKDRRIKYVIFQGRMFSSYATSSFPAWTWRPYSGINEHASHMHLSVQCDGSKDSTAAWRIARKDWFEMATEAQLKKIVRDVVRAEVKKEGDRQRRLLAVGRVPKSYNPDTVNLRNAIKKGA